MSLKQVIQQLLGPLYNEEEVAQKFNLDSLQISNLFKKETITPFKLPITTKLLRDSDLNKYRYYNTYLASRGINESTANKFDIGYDKVTDEIIFPIRDIHRNILGLGRRKIKQKVYNYPPHFIKPLYGVYELPERVYNLWVR